MANEFIARKGLIALESSQITGSLFVSGTSFFTGSVDISGGIENTHFIDFTTNITSSYQEGRINWIDDTKTLAIDTELNSFSIEVGHQNVIRVRNETGTTISRGRVVYLSGSSGNRPLIYTSSYEIDPTSAGTVGLVAADISTSNNGYVISNGLIRDINTTAYTAGVVLYLSSSGQLSTTAPVAPLHAVRMGKVITSNVSGIIHVDVDNGYEIGELHDIVDNTTSTTYGSLLVKSGSVWKDGYQLTGSYGLTGSLNATSFTGSLQGTASWALNVVGGGGGVTINNNVDNYLITATGTANTLDGESGLTFDGTTLTVANNAVITAIDVRNDPSTTIGQYAPGAHMGRDWPAAGGPALTAGNIVYFSGSSQWTNAQANATGSSTRVLGVVTDNADPNEIVLQGTVTINTDLATYQVGQPVYLSPLTAGKVTNVPPSSSGHVARYVGWVVDTSRDIIYFNPDFTYIQL